MLSSELPKVTVFRALQPENTSLPMEVSPLPSTTSASPVQFLKA